MTVKKQAEIPIEDFFEDILGKTLRGLGLSSRELSSLSGVSEEVIRSLKEGVPHDDSIRAIAPALNLAPDRLLVSSKHGWTPAPVDIPGLAIFNTPHRDMHVNAFLLWDAKEKCAQDGFFNAEGKFETVIFNFAPIQGG